MKVDKNSEEYKQGFHDCKTQILEEIKQALSLLHDAKEVSPYQTSVTNSSEIQEFRRRISIQLISQEKAWRQMRTAVKVMKP